MRGSPGGARQRDRASRSEAREHLPHPDRERRAHREGARLRDSSSSTPRRRRTSPTASRARSARRRTWRRSRLKPHRRRSRRHLGARGDDVSRARRAVAVLGEGRSGLHGRGARGSALPFEMVRPDLPYELASVIMKALEKDVASRYQSADELAARAASIRQRTRAVAGSHESPRRGDARGRARPRRPDAAGGASSRADRGGACGRRADAHRSCRRARHGSGRRAARLSRVRRPGRAAACRGFTACHRVRPARHAVTLHGSRAFVVVAACVAAGVGFGSYMFVTSRKPPTTTSPQTSARPLESSVAVGDPLPPAALDLPSAPSSARPAVTGVPPEPSASVAHPRRVSRPPPSATASSRDGDDADVGAAGHPRSPLVSATRSWSYSSSWPLRGRTYAYCSRRLMSVVREMPSAFAARL